MTILEYAVSLLTPLQCHLCKEEGAMLCASCVDEVFSEQLSRCYICNRLTKQQQVCSSCRSRSRLRRIWWLGHYEETIKQLILKMKYQRGRGYARAFGELLAVSLPYIQEDTLIVPVPTASKRVRQRGFDQAVLIAESLAKNRGLQIQHVLVRTTQVDQIGKRKEQRLKQMNSSLIIAPKQSIKGRTVLLVDDVLTTGATLETAARVLREAGAAHVDAAVIARHLPK